MFQRDNIKSRLIICMIIVCEFVLMIYTNLQIVLKKFNYEFSIAIILTIFLLILYFIFIFTRIVPENATSKSSYTQRNDKYQKAKTYKFVLYQYIIIASLIVIGFYFIVFLNF